MIGTFGNVIFEVSASQQRTFTDFKQRKSAKFASHDVLDEKQVLQFLGLNLKELSFRMRFDARWLSPEEEMQKLENMLNTGNAYRLIIGGQVLGKFVIEEINETWKYVDGKGRLLWAEAEIKVKEYV